MTDFKVPIVNWSYGKLRADHADKLECEMLSDVENPKKVIAVLATDNKGHSFLSKDDDTDYCNNFMLIRNKKTNALRIFPTHQYLMSPYCASEKIKSNSSVKKEEKNTNLSMAMELSKIMGSKRNKRRIMEIEKTSVKVENLEKKVKKAIKDGEIDIETEIKPTVTTNAAIVPPCNRGAESIEGVYDIREIMSPELLDALEPIAQDLADCKVSDLSKDTRFTKFFAKAFAQINRLSNLKVKMLIFADALVKFLAVPARLLNQKKVIVCNYCTTLNEKLISDFCITLMDGKLNRPPSMRDKALCYISVLLLLINDFTANISVLSDTLGTADYTKLPRLIRAVGARPAGKSAVDFILKLPLAELSSGMGRASYAKKRSK